MDSERFIKLTRGEKVAYLSAQLRAGDELAREIDRAATLLPDAAAIRADDVATRTAAPTDLQRVIVFGRRCARGAPEPSHFYQELEFAEPNLGLLERAFNRLIELHPSLRSSFDSAGLQVIHDWVPYYRVESIDRASGQDASEDGLRRVLLQPSMSSGSWPLFRVCTSTGQEGRRRIHVIVDLLIMDVLDVRRLLEQLDRLYREPQCELWNEPAPSARHSSLNLEEHPCPVLAEPSRRFWKRRFEAVAPGPIGIQRRGGRSGPGRKRLTARLSEWHRLRARAEAVGVTPELVMLCAFADVIAHWGGSSRFTLVYASWHRPPSEGGSGVNLGQHTHLSWYEADASVAGFLFRVKGARDQLAIQAEHAGHGGLEHSLRHASAHAGIPPFPVAFTQTLPGPLLPPASALAEGYALTHVAGVWLNCLREDAGDALHVHWDYDASVLDEEMTEEMFENYRDRLLELARGDHAWQAAPQPTSGLELLRAWNETAAPYAKHACIHQLFEQAAARAPHLTATVHQDSRVTYAELNARANRLARYLVDCGVVAGDLVGVCLERSHDMVAALLAIMKAGAAYVPLDAEHAPGRIPAIARKAELKWTLTCRRHADAVGEHIPRIINLDRDAPLIESQAATDLHLPGVDAERLAYVIFTSGSTGTPKGVKVRHRPVINLIEWVGKTFGIGPQDRLLFSTSLSFDLSVFDIFGMLALGGSIHIATDADRRDPEALARILCNEPITFWDSAPAALSLLVPWIERASAQIQNDRLRLVFLSGDWIPLALPDQIRQHFPRAEVISLGGATEATVWSNYFRVGAVDPDWKSIPYGKPIQNARYYILGPNQQPCPVGVEGDLYIGGECLSDGYLNDDELTSAAFIRDPFAAETGGTMYRTGDRARYFPDGNIEFLGRRDLQIKLRGHRIELGEIEHCLRSHPDIADAIVVVRELGPGDQGLVAYSVPRPGKTLRVREVRRHVREALPDYMVPNVVVPMAALPLNASGKVDRAALPWPPAPALAVAKPPIARPLPSAASVEAQLLGYLKQQLTHQAVAVDEDLFDLGATSLTMTRLIGMLGREFGVQLPLEALLDAPTVAAIAEHVVTSMAPAQDRAHTPEPSPPSDAPDGAVSVEALACALSALSSFDGSAERRHLYPAAGNLYSTQVYVSVGPGAVSGLARGIYYYHPILHVLAHVAPPADGSAASQPEGLCFILVADTGALRAIYAGLAARLGLLDGGYVGELLLGACRRAGIEVDTFHELDFDAMRPALGLSIRHQYCTCLADHRAVTSAPRRTTRHDPTDLSGRLPLSFPAPDERRRLEAEYSTLRSVNAESTVSLGTARRPTLTQLARRATRREYLGRAVPERALLALLASAPVAPSIELYVVARDGAGVEGLAAGVYAFDRTQRALRRLGPDAWHQLARGHLPFNRRVHAGAAFCILAFAPPAADLGEALVDAGRIGQRFMDAQAGEDLGLCPIGALGASESIAGWLGADRVGTFLHGWMGGVFDEAARAQGILSAPADTTRAPVLGLPASGVEDASSESQPVPQDDPVVIVGLACRFPDANDAEEYFDNLARGWCSFGSLSMARQRQLSADPDMHGGFLHDIASFDHRAFQISPAEAKTMDPQERLFLEVAWECLEDAGCARRSEERERVGVFVGAMWSDYQAPEADAERMTAPASALHSAIANRVSHFFDLRGPSLAVDTSCSSGSSALHLAHESLLRGECDAALVGAVNLVARRRHYDLLETWNVLSPDGRCSVFGAEANGWVLGEGIAAVLLRRRSDAEQRKDYAYALIRGTRVSHTGKTRRYGTVCSTALAENLSALLDRCGVPLETISYVECAAAGASLGDAAELSALNQAFRDRSPQAGACAIGSVKANIGHLESAAALSQLIKVIKQLEHGKLVPTLYHGSPNPAAPLDPERLAVNRELRAWPRGASGSDGRAGPRRALVTSVGASGSVAHVIVEEAPCRDLVAQRGDASVLVPVSAPSQDQLAVLLRKLELWLTTSRGSACRVCDIAHSLTVGRRSWPYRFAAVVRDTTELCNAIARFLSGGAGGHFYHGYVETEVASVAASPSSNDLDRLAQDWVNGAAELAGLPGAQRVPLPTHPWNREEHWIGSRTEPSPKADEARSLSSAETDLERQIERHLCVLFAEVAEIHRHAVNARVPLEEYGLTSLMIQQLNARLASDFGELPQTLFFEHRQLSEVARALVSTHAPALRRTLKVAEGASNDAPSQSAPTAVPPPRTQPMPSSTQGSAGLDIAVIGMSGRYPRANDLEQFWQNLRQGLDCITEIPPQRWDAGQNFVADLRAPGVSYCKWGGFIENCEGFDPLFFGIAPKEAAAIDPQERIFLELAWELFENAGYSMARLAQIYAGEVGVFVGVMYGEYQFFGVESALAGKPVALLAAHGSVANRVSYFFDFHGPSMAIDTLCSSSLTALHQAVISLRNGDCRAAVVGGINLNLHPNKYLSISQLQMASASGRCRPFSNDADGFVPGEGAGAILIKPLARAQADGDRILAVIKATAINHGGHTHAYTVPSPAQQAVLIETALRRGRIDPSRLGYVEAHGTGTALGDPIEVAALNKALAAGSSTRCAIGSVKSNIGHLEAAAGIAGIHKVVLQLQHRELVPSLHARKLNTSIDFEAGPFRVQTELAPWPAPGADPHAAPGSEPRRVAAVSSFGAGGANGHVILEEYLAPARAPAEPAPGRDELVLLSARTPRQLIAAAARLEHWLRAQRAGSRADEPRLADIAYTSQVGRTALKERLALRVRSLDELEQRLGAFQAGKDADGTYRSTDADRGRYAPLFSDEDGEAFSTQLLARNDVDKLAHLWITGINVPWERANRAGVPCCLPLPTYPFERQRYWLEEAGVARSSPEGSRAMARKPDPELPLVLSPHWRAASLPSQSTAAASAGTYLVIGGSSGFFQSLRAQWPGQTVRWLKPGSPFMPCAEGFCANLDDEGHYAALFAALAREVTGHITIVCAWPSATVSESLDERLRASIYRLLRLIRGWASAHAPRLRVVCPYRLADDTTPELQALGGFFRSVALEYSTFEFKLVGVEADRLDSEVATLALAGEAIEPEWTAVEVRYSEGRRRVLDYRELDGILGRAPATSHFRSSGLYVISGGSGKLGLQLARHIAQRAPAALLLIGRSQLSEDAADSLRELEGLGARVEYAALDLRDPSRLSELLRTSRERYGHIRGVIHAAGSLSDSSVLNKTDADLERVLCPKVWGLVHLDQATSRDPLDFFVIFSSLVGSIGNAGQCDYAFANAYADHFAERRARLVAAGQRRGRTLSIAWPYWSEGGMRAQPALLERIAAQIGLEPLTTASGLATFDLLLNPALDECRVLIASGHKALLRTSLTPSLLGLRPSSRDDSVTETLTSDSPAPERRFIDLIIASLARETQAAPSDIDLDLPFPSLGVTSIMTAELISDIDADCGLKLYINEVQAHDTVRKLATHIVAELSRQNNGSAFDGDEPSAPATSGASSEAEGWPRASEIREVAPAPDAVSEAPVIFVLSAPRSGSTLLRVMLMGHSRLFAPPELHLLGFDGLQARRLGLESQNRAFLREGFIDALRTLKQIDPEAAAAEMRRLEDADLSIAHSYDYLAQLCYPRRLVDKSPTYALNPDTLEQSRRVCADPFYVFLTRHPLSMMESFVRNRFDQMLGASGDPWELAERMWRDMNLNILRFVRAVPSHRQYRLRYEDLVTDPQAQMRGLCSALGLQFEDALLQPYSGDRMTQGLHSRSKSIGDPGFSRHQHIDATLASSWQRHAQRYDTLLPETRELAELLGYPHHSLEHDHDLARTSDQVA